MGLSYTWHKRLDEVPRADWDRLALPLTTPFLEWSWLTGLEESGCVSEQTGWLPHHLTVRRGDELIAAAPLYLKLHSWGEFVFDQQWAQIAHQLGRHYYPKLVGMSPFTPALGYRFLVARDEDEAAICSRIQSHIDGFCREMGISGCHFLHTEPGWSRTMVAAGMSDWLHHSLVWENKQFACFDDYLAIFKSHQRKNIRKERREIAGQDIRFSAITGPQAPPAMFSLMYDFYEDTCIKFNRWSHYLNREFFQHLAASFSERVLFIVAHEPATELPVAMSFFLHKGDRLYGRYWGCSGHVAHLHFETCYYQPIEWAIANGIRFFDAGSGRALHKKRRGFPAIPNYSLHRHYDPLVGQIWQENIAAINRAEASEIDEINRHGNRSAG